MIKRIWSLLAVTALILVLFAACGKKTAENKPAKTENTAGNQAAGNTLDAAKPTTADPQKETVPAVGNTEAGKLTAQEAEEIALADAGLTREAVTRLYSEFDYDDGVPQYEVQFEHEYLEYEYEIHAETGSILSRDKDRD